MNVEAFRLYWEIAVVVAVIVIVAIVLFRLWQRKRQVPKDLLPTEVRNVSHELSNEATKLRAGLKRISDSPDPIGALVEAMAGGRHGRHH